MFWIGLLLFMIWLRLLSIDGHICEFYNRIKVDLREIKEDEQ